MRRRGLLPRCILPAGVLLLLAAGCVFERRPDPNRVEAPLEAPAETEPEVLATLDPAAAAAGVVEAFRNAVAQGDISLALGFLHGEAEILDELVARSPAGEEDPTRGELLLALRRIHAQGLRLHPSRLRVELMDGVALVTARLDLLQPLEEGGELAVQEGEVWETVVLLATEEGWRIRHLHRSLLPLD